MYIEHAGDIAVLHLRAGKANAMSVAFLADLQSVLTELEGSQARAAVIVGDGRHFSAGLALPSLVGLDRAAMREFMALFHSAMLRVFSSERPIVAAVNGHAIAGGCVLALQCDIRLMAEGAATIGLNEVRLGIGLPAVVIEPLRLQLPAASLSPIALEGRLFSPHEALTLGLVDEVVDADALLARAIERARELCRGPRAGFAQVKRALRRPAIEAITKQVEAEGERWLDSWFDAEAQALLAELVAKLRG